MNFFFEYLLKQKTSNRLIMLNMSHYPYYVTVHVLSKINKYLGSHLDFNFFMTVPVRQIGWSVRSLGGIWSNTIFKKKISDIRAPNE